MKYNFESQLTIIGAGGFGREITVYLDDIKPPNSSLSDFVRFAVDDQYYNTSNINGLSVIKMSELKFNSGLIVIAIGDPVNRRIMASRLPKEAKFTTIIHPSAIISKNAIIKSGSVITPGCVITSNVIVEEHAHINLNTTIGHDCYIKKFFTSGPGANISGNCNIGEEVYVGSNACIREKVEIADNVTIGMGGVVVSNIETQGIFVGNPVFKLK